MMKIKDQLLHPQKLLGIDILSRDHLNKIHTIGILICILIIMREGFKRVELKMLGF